MYYKTYSGWEYYSPGKPAPKSYLDKKTPAEWDAMQEKKRNQLQSQGKLNRHVRNDRNN